MIVKTVKKEFLTNEKAQQIIKDHFLYLRGESNKRADFSKYDLSLPIGYTNGAYNWYFSDFKDYSNHTHGQFDSYVYHDFSKHDLTESIFTGTDVKNIKFTNSELFGSDFRLSTFSPRQFTENQKKWMIFTDDDEKKYLEYKNIKLEKAKIEEEKEAVENIGELNKIKLDKRDVQDESDFIGFFENLATDLYKKAKGWLELAFGIGFFFFLVLLVPIFLFLCRFGIFFCDYCYFINIPEDLIVLFPLSLFLMTILYYCLKQYYSFYKLYLQYENKVALIKGYLGMKTEEPEIVKFFAEKMGNSIFSDAEFGGDTKGMPVDTLLNQLEKILNISKNFPKGV